MGKVPGLPEVTPDQEGVVGGDPGAVDMGEVKRGPVGETLGKPVLVVMGGDPGKAEGLGVETLSVVPGEKGPVTRVGVETPWVVPVEEGPVTRVEVETPWVVPVEEAPVTRVGVAWPVLGVVLGGPAVVSEGLVGSSVA